MTAGLGRIGLAGLIVLALAGCSRASLLGGPGPEVAHHASPAETERLALLEKVRKFKSKDACKAHLATLAHGSELVEISAKEVRAYHSEGGVNHEYSCADKLLLERSWKSDGDTHAAAHHEPGHSEATVGHEAPADAGEDHGSDAHGETATPEGEPH